MVVLLMLGTSSEKFVYKTLLLTKLEFGNVESSPNRDAAIHDMVLHFFKSFLFCDNLFESYVWLCYVRQFTQMKPSVRDSFNNQTKGFSLL